MFMETATQAIAPMDFINQTNAAAGNYNSAAPIDMSKFKRAFYVISVGVLSATGTVDARLQSCVRSNFNTAVHNITGSNIVQITNSTANTNTRVTIEVRADQVSQQNSTDQWVRLNTTIGTATVNYEAAGYGFDAVQHPVTQYVNTTNIVLQQVVVSS